MKDEIIRMAREAGLGTTSEKYGQTWFNFVTVGPEHLERFAALVAAAERDHMEADLERMRVSAQSNANAAVEAEDKLSIAIFTEREACAKEALLHSTSQNDTANSIAKSIRARGNA